MQLAMALDGADNLFHRQTDSQVIDDRKKQPIALMVEEGTRQQGQSRRVAASGAGECVASGAP